MTTEAEQKFENALIAALRARDGVGRPIVLLPPGQPTVATLKAAARVQMEPLCDLGAVFVEVCAGAVVGSKRSEIAAWENTALLLQAVAAALQAEGGGMSEDVKQYDADGFKARVEQERAELAARLTKLSAFIASNPAYGRLSVNEQVRLKEQQLYMRGYASVLGYRLNNDFK
jgi:hypothetical protein